MLIPFISISQLKTIPDYSTADRKDVPIEFTWNLNDLYPAIEAWKTDKNEVVKLIAKIDEISKGWTNSPKKMFEFLDLYNSINLKKERLTNYASLTFTSDMGNTAAQDMKGQLESIFVQLDSKIAFINSDVLSLGFFKFNEYLKAEPKLLPYKLFIEDIIRSKDHVLPEEQQRILNMTNMFSSTPSKTSKLLNDLEIPPAEVTLSTGEKIKLTLPNYIKYRKSKNADDRRLVWYTFWANEKKFENSMASLLDGAAKEHFFEAQVMKYPDCLSSRLFTDNIDTTVYYQMVRSINNNLGPLHHYLNIKKKMLGVEKLMYPDIYTPVVKNVEKNYTYEEAQKLVIEATKPLGKEYTDILQVAMKNRWIDVYSNKGKESGAFSSGVYGVHPYVKLNYNGDYNEVSTLAHELGHTMHSYFANKTQPYATSNYPVFLAEIASTFNEVMLMNYMLKTETDDVFKLYILSNYLENGRNTLYRQALFAEFELAMHKRVEQGESLTADWMDKEFLRISRQYYGHDKGICELNDMVGVEWTRVPHFYYNFYVFQYTTGLVASMALSNMVLNGGQEAQTKYLNLLKSGGSDYAIPLLKNAGVDMTKKDAYNAAFKQFDYFVTEMEKIYDRLKSQGKM